MRPSLHIERRVNKLADFRMPEVITGVITNLLNPKPKFKRVDCDKWPMAALKILSSFPIEEPWHCTCVYCKLLFAYTHLRLEMRKAERRNSKGLADMYYITLSEIKALRYRIEQSSPSLSLHDHIKNAKAHIGAEISDNAGLAQKYIRDLEFIKREAISFLYTVETTRGGFLLYGPQPTTFL